MFKINNKNNYEQKIIFLKDNLSNNLIAENIHDSFLKKIIAKRVQINVSEENKKNFIWFKEKYGLFNLIASALFERQLLTSNGEKIKLNEISCEKKEIISILLKEFNFLRLNKYSSWFLDYKNNIITAVGSADRKIKVYKISFCFDQENKIKEIIHYRKISNGKTIERQINFFENGVVQSDETFYGTFSPKDISRTIELYDTEGNPIIKTNEYAANNKDNFISDWPTKEDFKYKNGHLIEESKEYSMNKVAGGIYKASKIYYEDTNRIKILSKNIVNDKPGSLIKITEYFDKKGKDLGIEKQYDNIDDEKIITREIEIFGHNKIMIKKKIQFRENAKQRDLWTKKVFFYSENAIRILAIVRVYGNKHVGKNRATIEHLNNFSETKGVIKPYDLNSPENKDFQVDIDILKKTE